MKTRLFLVMSAALFLISAGLLLGLTLGVKAQVAYPPMQPIPVKFADDFMREHGRQVKSYHKRCDSAEFMELTAVPPNKRFVVTDICTSHFTGVTLAISNSGSYGDFRLHVRAGTESYPTPSGYNELTANPYYINLNSGVVFESNETIYIRSSPSTNIEVTVCGFFVNL